MKRYEIETHYRFYAALISIFIAPKVHYTLSSENCATKEPNYGTTKNEPSSLSKR